jgi:hypothetical protein
MVRTVILPISLAGALLVAALLLSSAWVDAQSKAGVRLQRIDEAYTAKIKEYTTDPRISTELVDHVLASDTVPSPLKVLGRIPGTPDELTYSKDIYHYFDTLAQASSRIKVFRIGKTEEGREMIAVVIADAATIKTLDKWKEATARLTDPRTLAEAEARRLIATGKPIYYVTGSIHSPETGSPEMLMELGYRLATEETPFIQQIRNNVITVITPVVEVDGRDKMVDTWYFNKRTGQDLPLMYWGKYVAHDNNRDSIGQALKLTQNIMAAFLDWHPTVLHDLHERRPYLYTSTGGGPYNTSLDPVVINEWWQLSTYEIAEMTKRGVPGVWTYGYYDGWTPNYLFFIGNSHNAIGRFYETESYGPQRRIVTLDATWTRREWYRTNPPLGTIQWSPRNNVNMQESALLFALSFVAQHKETFLENYWLKNKRSIERGKTEAPYAWVIPAAQRRRVEAAELVNLFRQQGVEVHRANTAFTTGDVQFSAGDYILRMDQPYRTVIDMLMDVQAYGAASPWLSDDTGWTLPLLRNVQAFKVADKNILARPMTLLAENATVSGTVTGSGTTLIVDHTTENTLVTFRFRHRDVRMVAAEEAFDIDGHRFGAGTFIVPDADRAKLEPSIRELGLTAVAVASAPTIKTHDLDVPRIGYVHSWVNTQDEGWVRLVFDTFEVPYTYFADQKLREDNLRAKYDVIVYPSVTPIAGNSAPLHVNGVPLAGKPLPYKKTPETPNLGRQDEGDDIRGGMGLDGLASLMKFVHEGGTLIVDGSSAAMLLTYGIVDGVTVEQPANLFAPGAVLKAAFAEKRSPIAYGYEGDTLPVYFNRGPVWSVAGATASEGRLPHVVLRFPDSAHEILLSGALSGGETLTRRAIVVDAPLGKGHVVMFATRPYWRCETQGLYFLGFNAILNWNDLDAGYQTLPETQIQH